MNTLTAAEFIHEYWYLIIAMIAIISMVSITVYNWFKLPNNEQIEQVKQWLLYAVAKAEKELGSGTGQIKLRYVYNMFIAKFPAIALFLTFEEFSNLVDEALQELQELIDKNSNIEALIKGEDE
jgi:hypothetical protein